MGFDRAQMSGRPRGGESSSLFRFVAGLLLGLGLTMFLAQEAGATTYGFSVVFTPEMVGDGGTH